MFQTYDKYMKIKINSDDDLLLEKTTLHNIIILINFVFNKIIVIITIKCF